MMTSDFGHPRFTRKLASLAITVLILTAVTSPATLERGSTPRLGTAFASFSQAESFPSPLGHLALANIEGQTTPLILTRYADLAPVLIPSSTNVEEITPAVQIPMGLTYDKIKARWVKQGAPIPAEIVEEAPFADAPKETLVDFARNFIGAPYVFAGSTPYGFDCSGYIRFVYSHYGVLLYHGVREQSESGRRIEARHARPGDLVIWNDRSHSGIYAGDGRILHATQPGSRLVETELYTQSVFYVRIPVVSSK